MRQLKAKDIQKFRAALLRKQNGKCLICNNPPNRPCLDHSHVKRIKGTGLVRAVVCSSCNVMIAKAENNCVRYGFTQAELPTILRSIANYLERSHLPYIHPSEAPKRKKLMKSSYNELKKVVKNSTHNKKFPEFPKSGKLTIALKKLYTEYHIEPKFYK